MNYIEDILHLLVDSIGVDQADTQILTSISRQSKKGVALTDRQFELVSQKINTTYRQVLSDNNIVFDNLSPRLPLREIDRSKYITIVDSADVYNDDVYESKKEEWKWIKIRFPFSKKDILCVERIANDHRKFYYHKKGSHEHYFKMHELTVRDVVEVFKNKSFEINETLIEYYKEIKKIELCKKDYVSLYDNKFYNVKQEVLDKIEEEIGEVNQSSFIKLIDRRFRYGIEISNPVATGLKGLIAVRNDFKVAINPQEYSLNQIAESLLQLDRFPVLVVVDRDQELEQVSLVYNTFNGIVSPQKQTVLFRVENQNDKYNLNNYVHDKGLNNWLDKSTEIVYINKYKLPKLLLKTDWKPMCVLNLTSIRSHNTVLSYVNSVSDLILFHDKDTGTFLEKSWYRG